MSNGYIYKRCGCRHPDSGKPRGNACPKLRRPSGAWSSEHGLWQYQIELPRRPDGRRRQLRDGGFTNRIDAATQLDRARELLDLAGRDRTLRSEIADLLQATIRAGQPLPDIDTVRQRVQADVPLGDASTVAEYLTQWLTGIDVDDNTARGYESHVRVHLIPHLGRVRCDKLKHRHVRGMFTAIKAQNAKILAAKDSQDPEVQASVRGVRPTGPATCQRIRATLRKAINDGIRDGVFVGPNPAALVQVRADRALPIVWEHERIERWKATGKVPGPVMVWTDNLVGEFLDYAAEHAPDLYPMFHLIAYRGTRRGEACGLLDAEVRLAKKESSLVNQIATHGNKPVQKPPKSRAGNRDLALDDDTVTVLTAYRARRAAQKLAAGPAWPDTGLFFVQPNGQPWHPNSVTQRFRRLVKRAGLPPIRLHDLRHGAATMALAAGVDIKVVQAQLGHSTSTLTRDTYQSVVKQLLHNAAAAVAKTITRKRRKSARA
jgi:integrase